MGEEDRIKGIKAVEDATDNTCMTMLKKGLIHTVNGLYHRFRYKKKIMIGNCAT
jgi:hypothetical protein